MSVIAAQGDLSVITGIRPIILIQPKVPADITADDQMMIGTGVYGSVCIHYHIEADGVGERNCGGHRGGDDVVAEGDAVAGEGEGAVVGADAAVVGELDAGEAGVGQDVVVGGCVGDTTEEEGAVSDGEDIPVACIVPITIGEAAPNVVGRSGRDCKKRSGNRYHSQGGE